jgi:putative transposase
VRLHLSATFNEYRAYCKALSNVVMGHWSKLTEAKSCCAAVERLIHRTSQHPNPKYSYVETRFYKFPSCLRRAAIEFVKGQVSSFDLSASYNIAARYLAYQLKLTRRKDGQVAKDRSSCSTPRMPVTLSLLWGLGSRL